MSEDPPSGGLPAGEGELAEEPVPWHFKLLVVAVILYLGWRAVQLLGWVSSTVF